MIKKLFLTIIITISIIILYFNYTEDEKRNFHLNKQRLYGKLRLVNKNEINHNFASTDYLIKSDFIYYKDFSKQKIVKIDFNGNVIESYGNKGEGPKENLMIRGYDIDSNSYMTIDANKNSISVVSFKNELLKFHKSKYNINTGCFLNNNEILIKGARGEFGKRRIEFSKLNLEKDTKEEIDVTTIFNDIDNSDWIYDGLFNKIVGNGAVYATHYNNIFLRFNNKGELIYHNSFIYDVPQIKLSLVGKMLFPVENDRPNFYSFTANNEFIFFLTSIGDKAKKNQIIIDVYSLIDGDYYCSIPLKIDEKTQTYPSIIRVLNNQFFVFYENKYKIYDIKE